MHIYRYTKNKHKFDLRSRETSPCPSCHSRVLVGPVVVVVDVLTEDLHDVPLLRLVEVRRAGGGQGQDGGEHELKRTERDNVQWWAQKQTLRYRPLIHARRRLR